MRGERKNVTIQSTNLEPMLSGPTGGGYQGEHPLIEIRGSGVYVTEVKLRSNFSLRLCRPGAGTKRSRGCRPASTENSPPDCFPGVPAPCGLFAEGESEAAAQRAKRCAERQRQQNAIAI